MLLLFFASLRPLSRIKSGLAVLCVIPLIDQVLHAAIPAQANFNET